ncbi:MAG TPA: P-loop NTPase fold protein [Fulvivirga sp.]|nr:P-loop NTPase fold protein [Fulvivirga sp.]
MAKKYLTDKVLDDISKDRFGHANLASEIVDIIQTQETPLHIGIFGKWGVGKSTTVGFIQDNVSKLPKIKFIVVNVWKHQSEGLRRKFILDISEQLEIPIDDVYSQFSYGSDVLIFKKIRRYFKKYNKLINLHHLLPIVSLFFLLLYIAYRWLILFEGDDNFLFNALSVLATISSMGIIGTLLYSVLQLVVTSSTSITRKPFESEEQFEMEFKKMIRNTIDKGEIKKIVIFVDDLDRCEHGKVINALETIKTFLNIPGCIFLIACDPLIVKRAVIESNKILGFTQQDGAYYLEKFF